MCAPEISLTDPEADIRVKVAESTTDAEALVRLSTDDSTTVRTSVAANVSTPADTIDVLRRLAEDEDEDIRSVASENQSLGAASS